MSETNRGMEISYKCVQCGTIITAEQLSMMLGIKCPNCGYRILRKMRPIVVKKVTAK